MILERLLDKYTDLKVCEDQINEAFQALKKCYEAGGKVLLAGNGGSAADCGHIVGELMKSFMLKRALPESMQNKLRSLGDEGVQLAHQLQGSLPAISLTVHSELITAVANDVSADMIFAQQVYGYGKPEDIMIGFSTSGNSKNVLYAVQTAKALGMTTIGFTGKTGGRLAQTCDIAIQVPYDVTPDIQERHLPIYHALCLMLEKEFFA